MAETQDRDDGVYRCEICPKICNRDEISLMNEFDMDLCDDCLEEQRKVERECQEPDPDHMRDFLEEVKALQNLERRNYGR